MFESVHYWPLKLLHQERMQQNDIYLRHVLQQEEQVFKFKKKNGNSDKSVRRASLLSSSYSTSTLELEVEQRIGRHVQASSIIRSQTKSSTLWQTFFYLTRDIAVTFLPDNIRSQFLYEEPAVKSLLICTLQVSLLALYESVDKLIICTYQSM